jgi:hypothetical protein
MGLLNHIIFPLKIELSENQVSLIPELMKLILKALTFRELLALNRSVLK